MPSEAPPARVGPGGIGERPGRKGGAERRGPPGRKEQERAVLPGGVPGPLRPEAEARLGPFCSLSLSPTPTPPRAFSSPVGPKHRPRPLPKPHPCLGPALHRQGLFHLFFFSPPLFYYCGSVLPSSCCFIYIFTFIFFLTYLLVS